MFVWSSRPQRINLILLALITVLVVALYNQQQTISALQLSNKQLVNTSAHRATESESNTAISLTNNTIEHAPPHCGKPQSPEVETVTETDLNNEPSGSSIVEHQQESLSLEAEIQHKIASASHPSLAFFSYSTEDLIAQLPEQVVDSALPMEARMDAAFGLMELTGEPLDTMLGEELLLAVSYIDDEETKRDAMEAIHGNVTENMVYLLEEMLHTESTEVSYLAFQRLAEATQNTYATDVVTKYTRENPDIVFKLFREIPVF